MNDTDIRETVQQQAPHRGSTPSTLCYAGGDVLVTAALCAGLAAAGRTILSEGLGRDEKAVTAALAGPLLGKVNEGIADFLAAVSGAELHMVVVTDVVTKYRGDDLGLVWTWVRGNGVTSGVYPVNHKNEPDSGDRSGLVRCGRAYGILKRLTGKSHDINTDNTGAVVSALTRPDTETAGIGVLAFVGEGEQAQAVAYDPLLLYAMTGDDLRSAAVDDVISRTLTRMNRAAGSKKATAVYDNEGILLQTQHVNARALWDVLVDAAFTEGLYCSTLLCWFEARLTKEGSELLLARSRAFAADAEAALAFL